jgi:hypothetical protein
MPFILTANANAAEFLFARNTWKLPLERIFEKIFIGQSECKANCHIYVSVPGHLLRGLRYARPLNKRGHSVNREALNSIVYDTCKCRGSEILK